MPGPRQNQAFTPVTDVIWRGELEESFRTVASEILRTRLSDEAWADLCRVVMSYSHRLNAEVTSVPLVEQIRATKRVKEATVALQEAIRKADTIAMGLVVRVRTAIAWDIVAGRQAEFDGHEQVVRDDLTRLYQQAGYDDASDRADALIDGWQSMARWVRPDPVPDLETALTDFAEATSYLLRELQHETADSAHFAGLGFVLLIGELTHWAKKYGLATGVFKTDEPGKTGVFSALVIALLDLVPENRDEAGQLLPRQMRQPTISENSRAQSIIRARDEYEARGRAKRQDK